MEEFFIMLTIAVLFIILINIKMIRVTKITCPECGYESCFEGGVGQSMIIEGLLDRVKEEGATLTCAECEYVWHVPPQRNHS